MKNETVSIIIFLVSVFISSVSQVLLKKSAGQEQKSIIKEYLNVRVIIAYGIFFISTLLTMLAYRKVPLSMGPILEATGYLWVTILSLIWLKEPVRKMKWVGLAIILVGIIVFNLKL